jgi:uncharacterized phage protein (TIGR01671 family)
MRDIKFRAWDTNGGKMWTVSSIDFNNTDDHAARYGYYLGDTFRSFDIEGNTLFGSTCDCKIMQYTGLKDKHGKEIYEGDILRYDDVCSDSHILNTGEWVKGVVKWINDRAQFMPQDIKRNHKGGHYVAHWDFMIDIEVIGNIYENPLGVK